MPAIPRSVGATRRRVVLALVAVGFASLAPVLAASPASALPASVDLRRHAVAVGDQDSTAGCVGWAVGYALLGWHSRHDGYAGTPFAPMYVYSQINGGVDQGGEIVDALDLLRTQGIDTWSHYGPGSQDWATQPTAAERAHARTWRIAGYSTLFTGTAGAGGVTAIKSALAAGRPPVITLAERPGFDKLTGTAVDHDTTGPVVGTHVVLALGYDAKGLIVQNSFGTDWADRGFGRLGWDVVAKDVSEAYTVSGFLLADRTPPKVGVPHALVDVGARVGRSGTVPYEVSFTASDASGLTSTRLYRQVDGGAWRAVRLPSATARKVLLTLTPGHRYRFAAGATDRKNNTSARAYGPTLRVRAVNEHGAGVRYAKSWSTVRNSGAVGGKLRSSSAAGASVSLRFTGRGVAWYAAKGPSRSLAKVYLDGRYRGTVNLHRSSTLSRAVMMRLSTTSGSHRVELIVKKSGSRRSLDVDGFVVTV